MSVDFVSGSNFGVAFSGLQTSINSLQASINGIQAYIASLQRFSFFLFFICCIGLAVAILSLVLKK